ncbi:MAG TPA: FAD-dependent oxidoreductase [Chloroflexota bacterium]|nr:FAD-dependent oxidoreductase [Chloroflexota bacterium]
MDSSTDVLIIGGGILGCATAYYLASRGLDVLLVERGPLNREASGANAGSLHIQIHAAHHRFQYLENPRAKDRLAFFADRNRLFVEAARVWAGLEKELDADLGLRFEGGQRRHPQRRLRQRSGRRVQGSVDRQRWSGRQVRGLQPDPGDL